MKKMSEEKIRALIARDRADRRDRFAAAALTGILANPSQSGNIRGGAEDARKYADALIAELDKPQE